MTKFTYTAIDAKGKQTDGVVESDNSMAAINILRGKGLFPTNVVESTSKSASDLGKGALTGTENMGAMRRLIRFLFRRVSVKLLSVFTRQLSVLIDAGLPILKCLHLLREQEKNVALKEIIQALADSVEAGSTFSESLQRFPKVFTKLYISMVKAGESGGVLDEVLKRLSEFMEKAERLKARIKSAMIYPALVLTFAFGIVTFLVVFIIPKFAEIFLEMDIDLPALTSMMIALSDFTRHRWYFFILAFSLIAFFFRWAKRTPRGKFLIDKMQLKMPIFGNLMRKVAITRFTRTLGTLISSGVPILKALMIVKDTVGNEVISQAVVMIHDSIREGESIVGPLKESGVFTPMVVGMVDVGEQTGNLSEMLVKIADTYDEEIEVTVQGLTSILEPLLIITLAVIVGFIVIAMFLPLIKLIQGLA